MDHRMEEIFSYAKTNFTDTIHKQVYPAIDPTNPKLSQAGKTILITGGGDNLGLAIAQAFVTAAAKAVIITGRRVDVLESAQAQLEQVAKRQGSPTSIIARAVDITDDTQVKTFWDDMRNSEVTVDVMVSNAAKPPQPKPILEDVDDIWSQVETNARAPLYMAKHLYNQESETKKFIINVSSAVTHSWSHLAVAARPGTVLSKTTALTMFQQIALETSVEKLQIVSFNPGLLYNPYMKSLNLPEDKFDSRDMAAAFAVWAATNEAAFLHGRFVWASWDVDELATGKVREQLDADPYFLRTTVAPLKLGFHG